MHLPTAIARLLPRNYAGQTLHHDDRPEAKSHRARVIGLILGPVLGVIVFALIPPDAEYAPGHAIGEAGPVVAAVGVFMATLWVTEALPIAATALFPIALFPLLTNGSVSIQEATAPYAHRLIYLFMGGFMLALAMQQWGLHRRIALWIILTVGIAPARLVAGFMIACAFLSMFVSNTATAVMMLPIGLSVIEMVRKELRAANSSDLPPDGQPFHFAICLLLGIAYGSSIGGAGTLIGTPPNALMAAFVQENYGQEIEFARWMAVALPLVVIFLPLTWVLLTKIIYPIRIKEVPNGRQMIQRQLKEQGPMTRQEIAVLVVFVLTALAWMTRPLLMKMEIGGMQPFRGLSDAGIAIFAVLVLFAIPVDLKKGVFLLKWEQARKVPWSILLLFGGGLSLASAVKQTHVADFIGAQMGLLDAMPVPVLMLVIIVLMKFLTEMTSNTATIATFLPILGALAAGAGIDPMLLIIPATLAVAFAFMMPVGTPPNAIVFSSGELKIGQMAKAGLILNIITIPLVILLTYFVAAPILGIELP
ncbi:MAG: DASS family sodium-coupled anion symporter [Phycisphaerales bacterium]|nr:DASS family sodium-coupled anion symporter [Phycisphaerales bacterium]